ncbi:response regulator [Pseudofrankia inefficax]|uniref:Two component transcriptional regulator, LuxR family n=1 Tax=Pseudofrankia inefficax (strain DSM 45817 / CECT 9037 / DDB 130130 / EuI1c) TaxID=298654 RepID=E3J3Q5_PSEI1|nr:response regulator transcription factor [Pseudofrankia inefficax]ADP79392.1 two component transcriptional regulator, LuxR family [Pseudofrankia inefficax]
MTRTLDPIRILLADDHALFRDGIRQILETAPDLVVVGEAGSSDTVVVAALRTRPDVILLDVEMPGADVTVTVATLRRVVPEAHILVLTMYDGPQLVRNLIGLGIRGYLLKSATRHELMSAIRGACHDDTRVSLVVSPESVTLAQVRGEQPLSRRERDVLELAAEAMTNIQIASRLSLTEATVKRHMHNIFGKLHATSRIDAINKAVAARLITPPRPDLDAKRLSSCPGRRTR